MQGYEIHMGITTIQDDNEGRKCFPFINLSNGRADGCVRGDGQCFGTYMHGLFDNVRWTESFFGTLAADKGTECINPGGNVSDYKNRQYDDLADLIRCSVDMDAIYAVMNEYD